MGKKVAVVGAFDRFNYGDLLFPLIIERIFHDYNYPVIPEYYGIIDSDQTGVGGKRVHAIRALFREPMPGGNTVIVAGGDVLGIRWLDMHLCLAGDPVSRLPLKVGRKLLGQEATDVLSRSCFFRDKRLLPWVFSPSDFKSPVKIIYNAVGGSRITFPRPYTDYLVERLKESELLSVRDKITKKNLAELDPDIPARLSPDSAVIISELFPPESLMPRINEETKSIIDRYKGRYFIFQINKALGKNNEVLVAEQLKKIYQKYRYVPVLLPIGRATEHEDQVPLSRIHGLLNFSVLPAENGLFDIMALIANSAFYFGTSLHGTITAFSYGVPHAGLTEKVPKLVSFFETWWPSGKCVALEEIYDHFSTHAELAKDEVFAAKRKEMISRVYTNFEEILSKVQE